MGNPGAEQLHPAVSDKCHPQGDTATSFSHHPCLFVGIPSLLFLMGIPRLSVWFQHLSGPSQMIIFVSNEVSHLSPLDWGLALLSLHPQSRQTRAQILSVPFHRSRVSCPLKLATMDEAEGYLRGEFPSELSSHHHTSLLGVFSTGTSEGLFGLVG